MAAAADNDHSLDGSLAHQARVAFASIYAMLELKKTINTMVDQLNSFASEVTRVALEVGTEGKLGGQARVKGVGGVWKDLTAGPLPDQTDAKDLAGLRPTHPD